MVDVSTLVAAIRRKGVRLWTEGNNLRYQAPKGTLSPDELVRLRAFKQAIIELLTASQDNGSAAIASSRRASKDAVPLAFSQLLHWQVNQLDTRPSSRSVACMARLRGSLHLQSLRGSLHLVIERHEALRTQITVVDGNPAQKILGECVTPEINITDLTHLSDFAREAELMRLITFHVTEPVCVTVGPLFETRLFRTGPTEHVLLLAMEHTISDAFSRDILMREILTAYIETVQGRSVVLPQVQMHIADYAIWQRSTLPEWLLKCCGPLKERLEGSRRVRFPADTGLDYTPYRQWESAPLRIESELKDTLREWCRARGTTLAMTMFSAYCAVVLRWCGTQDLVIRYQINGRENPALENTLGYFAALIYVRVAYCPSDTFLDFLRRVTSEYCKAHEQPDPYYLSTQPARPDFTRSAGFNWVPRDSTNSHNEASLFGDEITVVPLHVRIPASEDIELDEEPLILLTETDDEVTGDVHFPRSRFSHELMERFARNFLHFVTEIVCRPDFRVAEISML